MYRIAAPILIFCAATAFAAPSSVPNSVQASPSNIIKKPFYEYPEAARKRFKASCVHNEKGLYLFCGCLLKKFQERMPFEDFVAMSSWPAEDLKQHKPYVESVAACIKVIK